MNVTFGMSRGQFLTWAEAHEASWEAEDILPLLEVGTEIPGASLFEEVDFTAAPADAAAETG